MKRISLKKIYPWYEEDVFVEVSEAVINAIKESENMEKAYKLKAYRYKAYFSLDCNDGIENDAICFEIDIADEYVQKLDNERLYDAIQKLGEKQAKRLYMYFFLDLNKTQIARIECVDKSVISRSIKNALIKIKKFL